MIAYPQIDPVALDLGVIKVHWYGLMYLIGFLAAWYLMQKRATRPEFGFTKDQASDLLFYGALGVIIGGRVGYVFFYNFDYFLQDPIWLFKVWTGGMSFHGGLLGVLTVILITAKKWNSSPLTITDWVAPTVCIGLGAGRLGNFIGAELYGKPTDVAWAMVFPTDPEQLARHPSQLYQFALEGVVMFTVLWVFASKARPIGSISGLFAILYGTFRFLVEFVRQPDPQLGYLAWGWLTMGQVLSLPLILLGVGLMVYASRRDSAVVR